MSTHDEYSSFIKTPQQLIVAVLLAFVVPIIGILLLIHLVLAKPSASPAALSPEAVAARIQPVGRVEFGAAGGTAASERTGEDIVKAACGACHIPGVANAPKIGDQTAWAARAKKGGLKDLTAVAAKGKGAMPPRGGVTDLSDTELARAIVYMANRSGLSLKVPAAPAARK